VQRVGYRWGAHHSTMKLFLPSRLLAVVCVLVPIILASATTTRAQTTLSAPRFRLVWEIAPNATGCPPEAAFRREVARRLGTDPFVNDSDDTITIAVAPGSNSGLRGRVRSHVSTGVDSSGSPVDVAHGQCRELIALLAGRVAVVFSESANAFVHADASLPDVAVDAPADDATDAAVDTVTSDVASEAAADVEAAVMVVQPVSETEGSRVAVDLGATAVVEGYSSEATITAGIAAHARARFSGLSLGLEVDLLLPRNITPSANITLTSQLVRGMAVACGHPWRMELCAVAGVGFHSLSVVGASGRAESDPTFIQAWLGPRVAVNFWQSRSVRLHARMEALWAPRAAELRLPDGSIWSHGLQLSVGIGATWTIP
jgi:hypothetical protein